MPHIENEGIRINYEVIGSGSPLVLQHGFFWSLDGWKRVGYVDALKDNHQLILIDARGHGRSDKPHGSDAYQLEYLVSDVTSVLDDLSIDRAHFWGFSMGGYYAFGMANHAPERLKSLIIGAAHPFARALPAESRPPGDDPEAFVCAFFRRLGIDRSSLSQAELDEFLDNDFHALSASLRDRPALDAALPGLNLPCLLYVGDKDGIFEPVKDCARKIPDAKLLVLPDINHPEAFYRHQLVLPEVVEFLRRIDSSQ